MNNTRNKNYAKFALLLLTFNSVQPMFSTAKKALAVVIVVASIQIAAKKAKQGKVLSVNSAADSKKVENKEENKKEQ